MDDSERSLIVIDEDGNEKEMIIHFTFESKEYNKNYVLFYDEENDEEIFVASYDDEGNLNIVEDEDEWSMVNEMVENYNNEEFEEA